MLRSVCVARDTNTTHITYGYRSFQQRRIGEKKQHNSDHDTVLNVFYAKGYNCTSNKKEKFSVWKKKSHTNVTTHSIRDGKLLVMDVCVVLCIPSSSSHHHLLFNKYNLLKATKCLKKKIEWKMSENVHVCWIVCKILIFF